MSSPTPKAISGLSVQTENVVMIVYPSIAATGLGRAMGSLCDSIPLKINGVKLSCLLFALPVSPIALVIYLLLKLFGERYVLTNRSLQKWTALGQRLIEQVALSEIDQVGIQPLGGQAFYHAADIGLIAADGSLLLRLAGVSRAEVFRQSILKVRDAAAQVEASLATIQARE